MARHRRVPDHGPCRRREDGSGARAVIATHHAARSRRRTGRVTSAAVVEHVAGVDVHVADRRRLALDFEDVDLTDAGLVVQISEDQDRSGEAGRVDRSAVRVRPVDLPSADTAACVDAAGVEHGPDFRSSTRHGRITDRRLSDEVRMAWHAKEVVRSIYDHHDPGLALEVVTRLGHDLQDRECPPELRQLGRTIVRWA
jgi:hypothetical protein